MHGHLNIKYDLLWQDNTKVRSKSACGCYGAGSDVYQALKTVVNVALVAVLKLPGFEPRMWQKRVDGQFHRELTKMTVKCY